VLVNAGVPLEGLFSENLMWAANSGKSSMTKRWGIFFSLTCEKLIELPDLIELPTPDLLFLCFVTPENVLPQNEICDLCST
jgi:hypothetical protein